MITDPSKALSFQLEIVAEHCEETGLKSGAAVTREAIATLALMLTVVEAVIIRTSDGEPLFCQLCKGYAPLRTLKIKHEEDCPVRAYEEAVSK